MRITPPPTTTDRPQLAISPAPERTGPGLPRLVVNFHDSAAQPLLETALIASSELADGAIEALRQEVSAGEYVPRDAVVAERLLETLH